MIITEIDCIYRCGGVYEEGDGVGHGRVVDISIGAITIKCRTYSDSRHRAIDSRFNFKDKR